MPERPRLIRAGSEGSPSGSRRSDCGRRAVRPGGRVGPRAGDVALRVRAARLLQPLLGYFEHVSELDALAQELGLSPAEFDTSSGRYTQDEVAEATSDSLQLFL